MMQVNAAVAQGQAQAPHPRIFEHTPISGAEIHEPTVPNLCMGVDTDDPLLGSFTPSMSLSGAPLESSFFSRFSRPDDNPVSPITDPHLSFLGPFSGLHMPDVVSTANEIRPDVTQPPSQQFDVPQVLDGHRKINPQTRFLQKFTEDILELDMDLIRHTLEDPVAFDPAQTTTGSDSISTSIPLSNCAVDTTLVLTQRMIKLFSRGGNWTIQSSVPQKSPLSTPSSFSLRFEQLFTENARQSTPGYSDLDPQQQEMNLDQTSILHALSTYMRLIEAYYLTFSQTTQKFGVALSEGSPIPLPSLQIGAFAMDDPAGHTALVIQSVLQLLDRLGDLVNKLTMPFLAREDGDNGISRSPTSPTGHNVISMVMITVRERESQLMQAAAGLESCCREARRPRERCP
ncbi:unnamed protein product [Penicillium palitans]